MAADRSNSQGSTEETADSGQSERANSKPGAKPRASRAGTRSVSTLNAAQLERKRANDREAQRAIRQRTKDHIERLERRIQELSGEDENALETNPALLEARKRNAELEDELRRLQATFYGSEDRASSPETSYSDAGHGTPATGSSGSYGGPWSAQHVGHNGYAPTSVPIQQHTHTWAAQVASYESSRNSSPYPGYPQAGAPQSATTSSGSQYGSEFGSEAGSVAGHPDHMRSFSTSVPPSVQRIPYRNGRPADYAWPSSGNPSPTPMAQMAMRPSPIIQNPPYQTGQSLNVWEVPLRFSQPLDPNNSLALGVIQHLRSLRAEGVTGEALIGPLDPNLGLALQPGYSNSVHALTHAISEVVNKVTFPGLVDKIGTFVAIYPMFQWMIANSYETYTRLPEHFAVRPSQIAAPHPIWASLLFWPLLRDEVLGNQEKYATSEFEYIYGASLLLNWPYQAQDAVERVGDDWRATAAFTAHARDLDNWSLGEMFQRRYPELRDVCRFTDYSPSQAPG